MGADSAIAWTDHTFNPWWGCTKIATGCTNCYASAFSKRTGHDVWGDKAPRRFFGDAHWHEPVKWNAIAEKNGVRFRVFCGSMCDVFENRPDLETERARLFDLIDRTRNLTWLLLTKRPGSIRALLPGRFVSRPNVVYGASVCSQHDEINLRWIVQAPGDTFLSCEPLVEGVRFDPEDLCSLDWLIVGGESGPGHRTMPLDAMRSLIDQADAEDIPVFVKQDSGPYPGKQGRIPDDLWARKEFPTSESERKRSK